MKSRTHLDAIGGTQGKASVQTVHPTPATPERRVLVPHSVMASQINAAVEAEREACAKIAEQIRYPPDIGETVWFDRATRAIAAAIRARQV